MKRIFLTVFFALALSGCATSINYIPYTNQIYPSKSGSYPVAIYFASQKPPGPQAFTVIGKVDIQGYASDDVNPGLLRAQATNIARHKGADAIINANMQNIPYSGAYVVPGHWGYYHYHPARYIPYGDTLLEFSGDLAIYQKE